MINKIKYWIWFYKTIWSDRLFYGLPIKKYIRWKWKGII